MHMYIHSKSCEKAKALIIPSEFAPFCFHSPYFRLHHAVFNLKELSEFRRLMLNGVQIKLTRTTSGEEETCFRAVWILYVYRQMFTEIESEQ
jgi:hypothetical protein